uniref:Uncharacterized protein n=1 Tax=Romanomermis culicivorax TaxID=13658 RepID=A0A915I087_ROMCU
MFDLTFFEMVRNVAISVSFYLAVKNDMDLSINVSDRLRGERAFKRQFRNHTSNSIFDIPQLYLTLLLEEERERRTTPKRRLNEAWLEAAAGFSNEKKIQNRGKLISEIEEVNRFQSVDNNLAQKSIFQIDTIVEGLKFHNNTVLKSLIGNEQGSILLPIFYMLSVGSQDCSSHHK